MSDDKPTKARPEGIRVKHIRFDRALDIPGSGMENALHGRAADPKDTPQVMHEVEYQPWIRHHRITQFDRKGPVKTIYIPEGWVLTWEPF